MATRKRTESDLLAEKTLAWVFENFPVYASGSAVSRTAAYRLESLLRAMCWRVSTWITIGKKSREEHTQMLKEVTKAWTPALHEEVVTYLMSGGFMSETETAAVEESTRDKEDRMNDVLETLEIENLTPRAQLSPEHELEEIVAEAERQLNPMYKSW